MKKLIIVGLICLGTLQACKVPDEPDYRVSYRGASLTVQSQAELDLVLDCVNDIVNGSESVKDNYDYYLDITNKPSNSIVLGFFEEVRKLSDNRGG